MNKLQKAVYGLDDRTQLFEKLEVKRARWFFEKFHVTEWIKDGSKILDIGSGVGDITKLLCNGNKNTVIGVDRDDFRRKGNKNDVPNYFIRCDALCLPFSNNNFDYVTLFWTLHHVIDPVKVLAEAFRVLQENGSLIIVEDIALSQNNLNRTVLKLYDKIVNMEFMNHPHNNKTLDEWHEVIDSNFSVKNIEKTLLPSMWTFNLIQYGILRFKKIGSK
jgi:ubiquinone/menaquinone biosynthesis C-methylase UbiE